MRFVLILLLFFPFSWLAYNFDEILSPSPEEKIPEREYDYIDFLYYERNWIPFNHEIQKPIWLKAKKTNKKLYIKCTSRDRESTFWINVFTKSWYLFPFYSNEFKKKSYYQRDDNNRIYVKDWEGSAHYVSYCDFSPINSYFNKK